MSTEIQNQPATVPKPVQQAATPRNKQKIDRPTLLAYLSAANELTQKQHSAMELMLQGHSDAQVASELHLDRTTVFRWRKSNTFAKKLDEQRHRLMEQSNARLQSLLDPALDILQKQLTGDDPKTALRAAVILVRMANPGRFPRPASAKLKPEISPYDQAIEDYINAPLPDGRSSGEPVHFDR